MGVTAVGGGLWARTGDGLTAAGASNSVDLVSDVCSTAGEGAPHFLGALIGARFPSPRPTGIRPPAAKLRTGAEGPVGGATDWTDDVAGEEDAGCTKAARDGWTATLGSESVGRSVPVVEAGASLDGEGGRCGNEGIDVHQLLPQVSSK